MAYVTPGTVAAGDVATAAAWNVLTNDVIDTRAVLVNVKSTTVTNITQTTTSATFGDITGLTVNITPSSATSLILVTFSAYFGSTTGDAVIRLVRGSTTIGAGTGGTTANNGMFATGAYATPNQTLMHMSNTFLDTPAATTATTYKLQWLTTAGTLYLNRRSGDTAYAASSTITVMEVPA